MKIDFYFDLYKGADLRYAAAYANPNMRPMLGAKRFKFTVEIDDPNGPDVVQEVKAEEVES